ncbi:hypothetical protein Mkiyose1088_28030 [Mycobacterium kiyosense]|nr:TetR/AcrR family transcriptional regulator [Mycobacterium kiyosense]GLD00937.1 hypothetical protein Mkiyose1088_28030 [Mycobacterium kiyosense]
MTKAQRRGSGESTKDAWLQIGYEVLAEEGFKALKLDVITARLGVTRGSFYWHFADMAAYKAALVANWAQWRDEDHQLMGDLAELAPRDRLIKMMSVLLSPRYWTLERAMREWARSDATAASSVLAADRRSSARCARLFSTLASTRRPRDNGPTGSLRWASARCIWHPSGRICQPRSAPNWSTSCCGLELACDRPILSPYFLV